MIDLEEVGESRPDRHPTSLPHGHGRANLNDLGGARAITADATGPAARYNDGMSGVAIRAAGLTKRYGSVRALDGLDLEVGAGEVHAFLGPNGAGKTTTIRVLLGLLRKDGGEVSLLGADPWRDAVELHRRLAYVPGDVTLWPSLTGGEIIDLLGRLRGGISASRRKALTERFDLDTSKRARAYSRGNRQKVALIAALASGAELLLLDEPTAGLDPLMEAAFRDCVIEERHDGRTILLSSHILSEAEALSDRVTIIRHGKTVETGTLAEMRHLTRISVEAELGAPATLDGMPGVHELAVTGTVVRCRVDRAALDEVVGRLHQAGIRSLTCRPPTLEELFLRHYSPERSPAGSP
jgi:ABC-2 type transport system ATP-binding protein